MQTLLCQEQNLEFGPQILLEHIWQRNGIEIEIAKSFSIETLDSAIRYLLFSKIETRKSIDPIFHEKETK